MEEKYCSLIYGIILAERTEKNHEPLTIADIRAKIWNQDLPKTKQERNPLGRDIRWKTS